jgi:CheY-like chemotaxis protein
MTERDGRMSELGELLGGIAAALWVVLALAVFLALRRPLAKRISEATKIGLGPTGVSMEFAERKLEEAVKVSEEPQREISQVAKRTVLDRLKRNADLLARARVLWVDDHPENNTPLIELLRQFGARVETPRSNDQALALLRESRYDVIISDVGRDDEGPNSDLKGVELAEAVFSQWGQRVLLFTLRFDPTQLPGASDAKRLAIARRVADTTFGRTNRYDEALHLILDLLEREQL